MTLLVGVVLATLGAAANAVAALLQHHAVRATAEQHSLRLATLRRLLADRRWLGGLAALVTGAALHAIALGLAPLTVIQPVGVLALGMTVLLTAKVTGSRPSTPVVLAASASTGGVGAFVVLAAGTTVDTLVTLPAVATAALLATGVVAGLAALGAASGPRVRCLAFATCGGISYGLVSVLMRALSQQVRAVGLDQALLLPALGIVGALLVGGWFIQHAYASGPPEVVVACLTVVDPLVAVAVGVGLLGEAANTGPVVAGLQVCCALLAASGVVALARHQVRQEDSSNPVPHPRPAADPHTGRELDLVSTRNASAYDGRNL